MKVRKSSRVKSQKKVVLENPKHFSDDGSDDAPAGPSTWDRDDDEDFNPGPPAAEDAQGEGSPDAADDPMDVDGSRVLQNDDDESDFGGGRDDASPRRARKARVAATDAAPAVSTEAKTGYMDITTARGSSFVQGFTGPFDRSVKGKAIIRMWYANGLQTMSQMIARWYELSVLPPKIPDAGRDDDLGLGVWTPGRLQKEAAAAQAWYERMKSAQVGTAFRLLSGLEASPYRRLSNPGSLPVLLGPAGSQAELHLKSGDSVSISSNGAPENGASSSGERANAGWLIDVGGVVPSLSWKPLTGGGIREQTLAMAVISHVDQSVGEYEKESQNPEFHHPGTVHIWGFSGELSGEGFVRASKSPARCLRILCLARGRAKRVQWSPMCGLLAVMCADGSVCIVEPEEGGSGDYQLVEQPVAVLDLAPESTKATAMAWVNCNRISIGYNDGSICLWSIFPTRLLSRHPVHHNHVMDMVSAYPTFPYLVSSSPVGGPPKLIDLRSPSYETTEAIASSVQTNSGLMAYSEHLLGFFFPLPSSNALSTVIGFAHHAYYPVSRRICTPDSFVTCLSAGRWHPYLLVGALDGSLWSLNPQCELFAVRYEVSDKIRVFQHEHRNHKLYEGGSPGSERGASRILQGFRKQQNPNPRNDTAAAKKTVKKGKGKAAAVSEMSKEVIHDPMTRITAVQWNPNQGFGCWAAAAMASGLVRVMDLGLESGGPTD